MSSKRTLLLRMHMRIVTVGALSVPVGTASKYSNQTWILVYVAYAMCSFKSSDSNSRKCFSFKVCFDCFGALFCLVLLDMVQLFGGALFCRASILFWAYWYNFSVSQIYDGLWRGAYFLQTACQRSCYCKLLLIRSAFISTGISAH